jgi:hypothetical protein
MRPQRVTVKVPSSKVAARVLMGWRLRHGIRVLPGVRLDLYFRADD